MGGLLSRARPRPCIGVTGPDRGGAAAWLATAWAVRRAGGRPLRIRPARPQPAEALDGLIIGGGADVSPLLYGEAGPAPGSGRERPLGPALGLLTALLHLLRRLLSTLHAPGVDDGRDRLELALLGRAAALGLPVLGICRGMQLINVDRGGDLHQSLRAFYTETPRLRTLLPVKGVELCPDSRLAALTGRTRLRVNALHDQGIRRLGRALRAVARETSGIIQAIEDPDAAFWLGVQWHPEYLPQRPEQRRLFQGLVRAAAHRH